MMPSRRLTLSPAAAILAAVVLLVTGAMAVYFFLRQQPAGSPTEPQTASAQTSRPAEQAGGADVVISLTPEAIDRAGIQVATVATGLTTGHLRIPGVVEPNAYRQVAVTPLAGGRITRVPAALGDNVRRGQTLAEIYSPELAEAQMQYVSLSAELEAAHQQLRRTERLAEIGSASKQELERIRAEHTTHETHVEAARSKLILLGMTPDQISRLVSANAISASVPVPAPIDGVVTERFANPGLNVDPGTKVFTVLDLSTVWIVGNVYERDFALVRVGSPVTVTTTAYPGLAVKGQVSYIDPQVNPETRTAKVRVEVGNPRREFRLGMYADLQVDDVQGAESLTIPKAAVQRLGDRQVVYVAVPNQAGRFVEREVRLGPSATDPMEVVSGLSAGDSVVVEGSFYLRAERDRLGLGDAAGRSGEAPAEQVVRMTVTGSGFEPSRFQVRAGMPARLIVTRTSDKTCATEIVIESLNIKRELPLNQPVEIRFTPKAGEMSFVCGMKMMSGTIVVK
jgi:RND family efflux transporter MFP subunit